MTSFERPPYIEYCHCNLNKVIKEKRLVLIEDIGNGLIKYTTTNYHHTEPTGASQENKWDGRMGKGWKLWWM